MAPDAVDPKQLRLVLYPDPVLRAKAEPVDWSEHVAAVARRMFEMMVEHDGIGLAGPQVGLPWRLFVCHVPEAEGRTASGDLPDANTGPELYLNPVITGPSGALEPYEEGCLSLPGISGDVKRPPTVTIEATGLDGQRFTRTATGLLARCWQHEFDHLEGVLIFQKMGLMDRKRNQSALRALEKRAASQ